MSSTEIPSSVSWVASSNLQTHCGGWRGEIDLRGCRKSANEIYIFSSSQDQLGRVLLAIWQSSLTSNQAQEDSASEGMSVKY